MIVALTAAIINSDLPHTLSFQDELCSEAGRGATSCPAGQQPSSCSQWQAAEPPDELLWRYVTCYTQMQTHTRMHTLQWQAAEPHELLWRYV